MNDRSAVGHYFARYVHADAHVPDSVVVSAWRGTVAEARTSVPALNALPDFRQPVADGKAAANAELHRPPAAARVAKWYEANDPERRRSIE